MGIDGIYLDIVNFGKKTIIWLAKAMTNTIIQSKYPSVWKQAKVIAILKPKDANDATSYRPRVNIPHILLSNAKGCSISLAA